MASRVRGEHSTRLSYTLIMGHSWHTKPLYAPCVPQMAHCIWCRERESNPHPQLGTTVSGWRVYHFTISAKDFRPVLVPVKGFEPPPPHGDWNLNPARLPASPHGHVCWCCRAGSNRWPRPYQRRALPTELRQHFGLSSMSWCLTRDSNSHTRRPHGLNM